MADIFTVAVTFTDRSRTPDGGYVTFRSVVRVLADDDIDATLVACQMTHAIRADLDPMVLGATITDVVI